MEPTVAPPVQHPASVAAICPHCHQPTQPEWYFCPNCGTNLRPEPLPTDLSAQILLYGFSIILPMLCFIFVGKWQGSRYARSQNPEERRMGLIAWALLIASTCITFYLMYIWTMEQIQSSLANAGI